MRQADSAIPTKLRAEQFRPRSSATSTGPNPARSLSWSSPEREELNLCIPLASCDGPSHRNPSVAFALCKTRSTSPNKARSVHSAHAPQAAAGSRNLSVRRRRPEANQKPPLSPFLCQCHGRGTTIVTSQLPVGWCQTNANSSHFSIDNNLLGRKKAAPLSKSGGAVGLEILSAVEGALLVEMVED